MSDTPYYDSKSLQPWTVMEDWMTPLQFEGFLRGNVIKYIGRYPEKGGYHDLKKAKAYLERLMLHYERYHNATKNSTPRSTEED